MSYIERKDWKKYIWVIPAIGCLLAFIGLLTPSAYVSIMGVSEYMWMWGLWYATDGYDSVTEFYEYAYEIFIPSLICFVLILIGFIILIGLTASIKKNPSRKGSGLINIGIYFIIIVIIYAVAMHIGFPIYYERYFGSDPGIDFWDGYDPHFGVVGPVIAGICAIIGGIIAQTSGKIDANLKKQAQLKPQSTSTPIKIEPKVAPIKPLGQTQPIAQYCTKCGAKLTGQFCGECGAKAE